MAYVVVGLMFDDILESFFGGQILLVGCMLILTGLILFLADRAKSTTKEVSFSNSIVIGLAQAIAILPGISRSGATISTSVLLGVDRSKAASFSFLMVVPLILGKIAKDLIDGGLHINGDKIGLLIAGFIAAFVTGLFACQWMIKLVRNAQLKYFSYYCFVVGSAAIIHQVSL
jgi:undecaprenyl-diphosphatase